ncbi:UDP-3-O-[3-hydroxymyristoyl] N-acetylglucosamine deacetylase [Ancylobacter sp. 3268]|uniref:UDP-3-O-acyl-N-acetylglucosamine deacetylase n=1 Tax=Ancylobacter sp. 3268 TaxID=2817752 RepID=UPI00286768EB|nr:UDP-3-O-acyl-N-acetylglucosamine deacetylase [Ancylobacter sp. 3268]MDR6952245.1 UDP-3-O-[3-hydroxymyristoyl] N-acetylglucosamine deacetylase [Ancylobacter sp. 3268]
MNAVSQTTLADSVAFSGVGVHSGKAARMTVAPAPADTGIVFLRSDASRSVRACRDAVRGSDLATVLRDESGPAVSTVEHLLACFAGLGIDNARVEIDGPEVPILDGSADEFVTAIDEVGIVETGNARRYLKVLKTIRVETETGFGELSPYDMGFRLEVEIDFAHAAIGRQRYAATVSPEVFRRDLAPARTFGFLSDVNRLWEAGYALGASLENTICVSEDGVVNEGGLRWSDEFVRHKALDALGDLALGGLPLLARYRSYRGGHKLNFAVVDALLADRSAYEIVEARLPSRRALRGTAGLGIAVAMPAHAPEL